MLHAVRDNLNIDLRESAPEYFKALPIYDLVSYYPATFPAPEGEYRIPASKGGGEPDVRRAIMSRAAELAMVPFDTNAPSSQILQGWLMHERACKRDALLLAARQRVHGTVKTVAETDFREHRDAALASLCAAHAVELERESDVLLDVQRGEQVEELIDEADACAAQQSALRLDQRSDIATVDFNRAAVRPIDAADEIEESRFARAAASDDRDSLAAGYVRVGLVKHAVDACPLAKAATKLPD